MRRPGVSGYVRDHYPFLDGRPEDSPLLAGEKKVEGERHMSVKFADRRQSSAFVALSLKSFLQLCELFSCHGFRIRAYRLNKRY